MNDLTINSISGPRVRKQSYYDVLGVSSDAPSMKIRESYFRLKNTYTQTNQALYSLVDHSDIDELSKQIEVAYETLLNPVTRRTYNQQHGFEEYIEDHEKCEFLVERAGATASDQVERLEQIRKVSENSKIPHQDVSTARRVPSRPNKPLGDRINRHVQLDDLNDYEMKMTEIIGTDACVSGEMLKSIRELSGTSATDLQHHTKLSIGFIQALESDAFDRLPQESYLKGFLYSYFSYLRVKKSKEIIDRYLGKFRDWKTQNS